jgi:hypothetical protein
VFKVFKSDPNPEVPGPKRNPWKVVLKVVLWTAKAAWSVYRGYRFVKWLYSYVSESAG